MQLQVDFDHREEFKGSSDNILAGEYPVAADQNAFQLGFDNSKSGKNDKYGNPIITVIDRSGIHEIGIRWCYCSNSPKCDI
jgi:hypothetical protein